MLMPQLLEKERISAEEKALILGAFNDTQKPISDTDTAITLFEKQVALTPERIALIEGERKITYAELNCMANNLATKLRNFGVKPDSTVALICKRSTQLLAAIYGILKAGGAYVRVSGRVKQVDAFARTVSLEDGTVIPIEDISGIESALFRGLE